MGTSRLLKFLLVLVLCTGVLSKLEQETHSVRSRRNIKKILHLKKNVISSILSPPKLHVYPPYSPHWGNIINYGKQSSLSYGALQNQSPLFCLEYTPEQLTQLSPQIPSYPSAEGPSQLYPASPGPGQSILRPQLSIKADSTFPAQSLIISPPPASIPVVEINRIKTPASFSENNSQSTGSSTVYTSSASPSPTYAPSTPASTIYSPPAAPYLSGIYQSPVLNLAYGPPSQNQSQFAYPPSLPEAPTPILDLPTLPVLNQPLPTFEETKATSTIETPISDDDSSTLAQEVPSSQLHPTSAEQYPPHGSEFNNSATFHLQRVVVPTVYTGIGSLPQLLQPTNEGSPIIHYNAVSPASTVPDIGPQFSVQQLPIPQTQYYEKNIPLLQQLPANTFLHSSGILWQPTNEGSPIINYNAESPASTITDINPQFGLQLPFPYYEKNILPPQQSPASTFPLNSGPLLQPTNEGYPIISSNAVSPASTIPDISPQLALQQLTIPQTQYYEKNFLPPQQLPASTFPLSSGPLLHPTNEAFPIISYNAVSPASTIADISPQFVIQQQTIPQTQYYEKNYPSHQDGDEELPANTFPPNSESFFQQSHEGSPIINYTVVFPSNTIQNINPEFALQKLIIPQNEFISANPEQTFVTNISPSHPSTATPLYPETLSVQSQPAVQQPIPQSSPQAIENPSFQPPSTPTGLNSIIECYQCSPLYRALKPYNSFKSIDDK